MLTIDFMTDWKRHVTTQLISAGFAYNEGIDLSSNSLNFLKILRRHPGPHPRQLFFADTFYIPPYHQNGFENLLLLIRRGDTLLPYMSRSVSNIDSKDQLLDDWGIYHFHLGEHLLSDGFMERTKYIAFCWIDNEAVYFVGIHKHGRNYKEAWVNANLIQTIHNNWPQLMPGHTSKLSGTNLTETQRKNLRSNGYNVDVGVSDGTVYFAPGGGIMPNGVGVRDFIRLQYLNRLLEYIKKVLLTEEIQVRSKLGLSADAPLTLKARFHEFPPVIFEPKTKAEIRVPYPE